MKVSYKPVTREHVKHLSENIRSLDLKEIEATISGDTETLIGRNVCQSVMSCTVFFDGELAAIVGVTPINQLFGIGSPWMLGTDVLIENKKTFLKEVPKFMHDFHLAFPKLENYVHHENKPSIMFLKFCGFTIHDPAPYGCKGDLFHKFTSEVN